ncbi:hypothetical protein, conserved [Babesia bigemina]|uniref:C3H1-type domain-containing protein n=1 Tax=Babesia bigemina TaxID=5866 RepID=A0A061BLJ5_BABBI|nr:hypothetical protein, conserved [Babesia bigemina]CDR71746.1 hypothetical protein, conserved [Babesia bigemina]|eukprot:XP_012770691.1 hypothetical protein, conserved [Babesia bigemina]
MGFLSGVLSNIREHLGQHKDTLDIAINTLNKNKHAGKNGFNEAIEKVVEGVRGYNDKVRESNEKINGVIINFTKQIKNIPEAVRNFNDHNSVNQINDSVDECIKASSKYVVGMLTVHKEIKDLEDNLENKVNNTTNIIEYQYGRLSLIYEKQKEDLQQLTELLGEQHRSVQKQINKTTEEKVGEYAGEIYARVDKLKSNIVTVNGTLKTYVSELENWIEIVQKSVEMALKKVETILNLASGNSSPNYREDLENAVKALQQKCLALFKAYDTANKALPGWMKKLQDTVGVLDDRIQKDLETLLSGIKKNLTDYLRKINEDFEALRGNIVRKAQSSSLDKSIAFNWEVIKRTISGYAANIYKEEKKIENTDKSGMLHDILTAVLNYGKKFTTMSFGKEILDAWMKEILVKNDRWITGRLDTYVRDNGIGTFETTLNITSGSASTLHETIKKKITAKLQSEIIQKATQNYSEVLDSVAGNLGAIHRVCERFAKDLNEKIASNGVSDIAEEIAREIERGNDGILKQKDKDSNHRLDLTTAIERILHRLTDRAKEFVSDVEKLVKECKLENVDASMKLARNIRDQLDHKYSAGKAIDVALEEVTSIIELLDTSLSKEEFEGEVDKAMLSYVKGKLRSKMEAYNKHVTNSSDENTLAKAIKDVEEKALEPFYQPVNTDKINDATIHKTAKDIGANFAQLCDSILKAASTEGPDSAKRKLEDMKNYWIGKDTNGKLKTLKENLNTLQKSTLFPLISKTQEIAQRVSTESSRLIRELSEHVNQLIDNATNTVTHDMQRRYVIFMRYQLEEFSNNVTKVLTDFPEAINKDADKNHKGFMKVIQTKLATSTINSTLNLADKPVTLTTKVTIFFSTLLDTLKPNREIMPSDKLSDIREKLNTLLSDLSRFNRPFVRNLTALSSLLDSIRPASYADDSNPLLDCLKKGVQMMCEELKKAYVSVYDGETFGANLVEKEKLTPYGTQLSKVLMSILEIYNEDLRYLKNRTIHKWSTSRIYAGSSLGTFLQNSGYSVSNNETEQNGHLDKNVDGTKIMSLLVGENYGHVYHKNKNYKFQLENLYDCLTTYYRIRHISTAGSKKSPCNIYEMLCWLTSLRYSSVYSDFISDDFSDLFDKREMKNAESNDPDFIPVDDLGELSLKACPQRITYGEIHDAIVHVTAVSSTVLTTIVGYGDAHATYAVDFYSNALRLSYPSSSVDCLNMLIEVLGRLLPVFTFLHGQCSITAKHYGWSNCLYGKGVKWSTWPCDEHSKTEVECHAKSPLQSFLRDCLPGYLPHQVESVGCKSDCKTCPKSLPGAPCITPLGFRSFTGSKKTGKDLCNVLTKFMGNGVASPLFSLTPKPPKTLAEHFGFALSLVRNWQRERSYSLKTKMVSTIEVVSIGLCKNANNFTNALSNAYGDNKVGHESNGHRSGTEADLASLSTTESCVYPNKNVHCAPYLQSLYSNSYMYVAEKHASAYLSWALYLPWNLHSFLKSLLDAFSNIVCQDWGCSRCAHGSACRRGNHGVDYNCQCRGIIECRGVQSTLYSFGFMFGNSEKLAVNESKRYCHNFYKQLRNVLNSQYFTKLFEECDNFIWTIREPFTYLVLAFWSLSLFYLICVMVGRLDVLHIKSHLHSPSSHRIAAQSLLAAGRVNKLNRVFYLQP